MSVDHEHVAWYFDGAHRNLTLVDIDTDERWTVNINGAPAIEGFEVWHPRWTNDPRFLVLTGPYTVGRRANRIRGGGGQVEIFLGRFNATFTAVDQWTQITRNDLPDFYPDAWIDERTVSASPVAPRSDAPPPQPVVEASPRLVVDARVVREVAVPTPQSIAPYTAGLLAMEYEVLEVLEGEYEADLLVAAHWIIHDRQILSTAARPADARYQLTLERYDMRPDLEGERLVIDTRHLTLPLYYDTGSAPD